MGLSRPKLKTTVVPKLLQNNNYFREQYLKNSGYEYNTTLGLRRTKGLVGSHSSGNYQILSLVGVLIFVEWGSSSAFGLLPRPTLRKQILLLDSVSSSSPPRANLLDPSYLLNRKVLDLGPRTQVPIIEGPDLVKVTPFGTLYICTDIVQNFNGKQN